MTHEIYERFDTFLKKLEARANDVISQAKPQIPEIYASDEDFYKRSFELFKNNLTGELHSLIRKAETVFSTQIIPFEQQSGLIESRAAKHYSKKFEDWKDRLEFRIDALFENFQPKNSKICTQKPLRIWMKSTKKSLANRAEVKCTLIRFIRFQNIFRVRFVAHKIFLRRARRCENSRLIK